MKRLETRRLANPRLCVQSLAPAFGDNYKPGFVGFLYTGSAMQSRGIAYFTHWSRLSDIHVHRTLIVTGENECVELSGACDVVQSPLDRYFDDPKTQIFFRKPKKCTGSTGMLIAQTAIAQVGTKADQLVAAARILEGSFLRRWMMSYFRSSSDYFAAKLAMRDRRWLSAELVAYCLDCQPGYADRGSLALPAAGIGPQALFEDPEIFAAWKQEHEEGPKFPMTAG